jgi:hypothetical protein
MGVAAPDMTASITATPCLFTSVTTAADRSLESLDVCPVLSIIPDNGDAALARRTVLLREQRSMGNMMCSILPKEVSDW